MSHGIVDMLMQCNELHLEIQKTQTVFKKFKWWKLCFSPQNDTKLSRYLISHSKKLLWTDQRAKHANTKKRTMIVRAQKHTFFPKHFVKITIYFVRFVVSAALKPIQMKINFLNFQLHLLIFTEFKAFIHSNSSLALRMFVSLKYSFCNLPRLYQKGAYFVQIYQRFKWSIKMPMHAILVCTA